MWDDFYANYITFLLIFARMMGMIIFNPIMARKSVPVIVKMGLAFFTTLILLEIVPKTEANDLNTLTFMFICIKEVFIGFFAGFIMQLFFSVVNLAGEFMDLQLGVGMAKIYDPQSNVSQPLLGTILTLFFTVMFFVTNAHLTLLKIVFFSFDILPLGSQIINFQCGGYIVLLFSNILILALKLALPIVAIEMISEIGLGILMRSVPQINVFVVGLQLKLLIGLLLIVLVFPGFFDFFDSLTSAMFDNIISGLKLMV